MNDLAELLSAAPPRPVFTNDASADAPRLCIPRSVELDIVELYTFFHGLIGLEFAAKSFRAARPGATRQAFTRHLLTEIGR